MEKSDKYEQVMLPLAESIAKKFVDRYEDHQDEMQIEILNFSKNIVIKANSPASELHSKLIEKFNATIAKVDDAYYNYYYLPEGERYPPLTYQDIEISFSGYQNKLTGITISIGFQNLRYMFYNMPYDDDGIGINRIYGLPSNEECLDLLEKLDLLNMELPLGYSGNPENYFTTLCPEDTWLYF